MSSLEGQGRGFTTSRLIVIRRANREVNQASPEQARLTGNWGTQRRLRGSREDTFEWEKPDTKKIQLQAQRSHCIHKMHSQWEKRIPAYFVAFNSSLGKIGKITYQNLKIMIKSQSKVFFIIICHTDSTHDQLLENTCLIVRTPQNEFFK